MVRLRRQTSLNNPWPLVPPKIPALGRPHLGHRRIGLAVVVGGIPEQKADSARVFRRLHLDFDVLWRVGLGPPAEGLQPWTYYHVAPFGDQLEALHGFANKMLGRITRMRDP